MQTNERNTRKEVQFITINFYSKRQRNILKHKNVQNLHRQASLYDHVFKLTLHAKAKVSVFTNNFCSHFISYGLANCPKS